MKIFWILCYNIIIYPITFFLVFSFSLFNNKVRKSFNGRLNSISKIHEYFKFERKRDRYWFHVSSLGEYYQTKSIIELIKFKNPNSIIKPFPKIINKRIINIINMKVVIELIIKDIDIKRLPRRLK